MPVFEAEILLPRPLDFVFDFFCRPANLLALAPPELKMDLIEAPERIEQGSRIVLRTRRWGITQQLAGEVTVWEPGIRFVEEQREGPFRKWAHHHFFEEVGESTQVRDRIEYEGPGGALGLLMTARLIESELQQMFAYRQQKLQELMKA